MRLVQRIAASPAAKSILSAIVNVLVMAWLALLAFSSSAAREPSIRYALALFAISNMLELLLLAARAPDNGRLVRMLAFCELPKVAFLGMYFITDNAKFMGEYYAWSSLMVAAAVVAGMAMLAARIVYSVPQTLDHAIEAPSSTPSAVSDRQSRQIIIDATIDTIRRNRLYALCTVLVAFLHVTYFTALAIAIHDRTVGPDLQANRPSKGEPANRAWSRSFSCDAVEPNEVSEVYFPAALASLECTDDVFRTFGIHRLSTAFCAARSDDRQKFVRDLRTRNCRSNDIVPFNILTFLRVASLFEELAANDDGRILVEVRGHADITRMAPGFSTYVSNAELANQRAQATEAALRRVASLATERHGPLEIEWRTYGVSSEPSFLATPSRGFRPSGADVYRSAEIQIVRLGEPTLRQELRALGSHDRLDLLDYLYFTIYTITTTGYGDIIPLSPFARFVVSVANLYELFFVAIIFNIVAAAGRD